MKTYVQHDDNVPLIAPEGGAITDTPYLIGAIFGMAMNSADEGQPFELRRKGVISFPKKTAEAWTQGAVLYWDPVGGNLTTTAGSLKKVALAQSDAAANDARGPAIVLPLAL